MRSAIAPTMAAPAFEYLKARTGIEARRLGEHALQERVALFGGRAFQPEQRQQRHVRAVRCESRGVPEQLTDGHLPVGRLHLRRQLGEGLADRRLERHQPFLGERADEGSRDGLRERSEVHPVSGRNQVAFPDPPLATDVDPRRAVAPNDDRSQPGKLLRAPFGMDELFEASGLVERPLLARRNRLAGDQNR